MIKKTVKKTLKSRNIAALKAPRKVPQKVDHKVEKMVAEAAYSGGVKMSWLYVCMYYVAIVSTIFYFSYSNYKTYIEKKRAEMSEVAYSIEMNFLNTLGYAESTLNHINRQIASSNASNSGISEILASFNKADYSYNSIKDILSVGMFYWVDANKHLVASSAGPIVSPVDLSNRDYLEMAKKNPDKIYSGVPVVGASSGQHVIPAGVAVMNSKGHYLGTSVVSFKIDGLVEKFKRLIGHYKTDFAILDDGNKVLMESDPGLFSEKAVLLKSLDDVTDELHEETVSTFSFTNRDGGYIMVRNVRGYPYKILTGYKNDVIIREVISENMPHLVELLIITAFFAMIGILFVDHTRRK